MRKRVILGPLPREGVESRQISVAHKQAFLTVASVHQQLPAERSAHLAVTAYLKKNVL